MNPDKQVAESLGARSKPAGAPVEAPPLEGLYGFVRTHLSVVNGIVLASGTLVASLDFLAPRLSLLPTIVYSATFGIMVLMVFAAVAPALVGKILGAIGLATRRDDLIPLWRKPLWQVAVAVLGVVTIAGYASVAKASAGGLIASASPTVKTLQDQLLSLDRGMTDISAGVGQANAKLDRIALAVDPNNPADRCPDLGCAVMGGASPAAVRKLIEKGAKVPGDPINDGVYLLAAALSTNPGRFEVIDLLASQGIDKGMLLQGFLRERGRLTKAGALAARDVVDAARMKENPAARFLQMPTGDAGLDAWNDAMGCFLRTSGGVSLLEVAALMGDTDLYTHLKAGGGKTPARPLTCAWQGGAWQGAGKSGKATIEIDPTNGKFLRARVG